MSKGTGIPSALYVISCEHEDEKYFGNESPMKGILLTIEEQKKKRETPKFVL